MKFLSVISMAAAVSAAAVAPRDDWNGWGQQCSTVTVTNTVWNTATVTSTVTATVTKMVTSWSTATVTTTATVTQECQQGWGGWNGKE